MYYYIIYLYDGKVEFSAELLNTCQCHMIFQKSF